MDINILEGQWQKIDKNSENKSIRISNECVCDLYLGFDKNLKRRLILSISPKTKLRVNDDIKEYISFQYFDISNHLVITLLEERFYEVFNAFIISVYFRIKSITNVTKASMVLSETYYEWSEFFTEKINCKLRLTDLLGIFGELFILKKEIERAERVSINEVLECWKGPYGIAHDFVFDRLDIEVKAIDISKTDINISSEYQLDCLPGKQLLLKVLKTEINGSDGIYLSSLVEVVRNEIIAKQGNISIFLKSLQCYGLSLKNVNEYDIYKFKIREEATFDCTSIDFPKLTRSNIPKEISSISYVLKTTMIQKHLIETIAYGN